MSDQAITSIDQLAAAIESSEVEDGQQEQQAENAQPEGEAQNGEQAAQEGEGEQEQPAESEGDQPAGESLDDKVVTWETASGEKFEVPVAELKNGYMREQDYRHKTQNLATEREQATKQIQDQYQFAQTYAQELGTLNFVTQQIAALEQAIPNMDRHGDPVGYVEAVNQLQTLREHRTGIATRVQQVEQQRQAEQQTKMQQAKQAMVADLQMNIPNFNQELVGKLNATAQTYGFKPEELTAVTDPRFVRILHDAMQFKALKDKAPGAVQKVKNAPIKPTKQASTAVASGVEQQVKQFAKNKSLDNFAQLLQHTI